MLRGSLPLNFVSSKLIEYTVCGFDTEMLVFSSHVIPCQDSMQGFAEGFEKFQMLPKTA
jgi:hypothetical protein